MTRKMVPASSFPVFLEFSKTQNREEGGGGGGVGGRLYHSPQTTSTPHNPNLYHTQ